MQDEAQRIERWSVIAGGRLAGDVYNRPGHRPGARILTSPIVEIRTMGTPGKSFQAAFTESGSVYRLGEPAASFSMEAAQQFIGSLTPDRTGHVPPRAPQPAFDGTATVIGLDVWPALRGRADATTFGYV